MNKQASITQERIIAADEQIRKLQKDIRYDTRDFPIESITKRFRDSNFYIPVYQREFVWDVNDQSSFIESVLIGLPIPMMFLAEVESPGAFEIVDGVQRISTLVAFQDGDLVLKNLSLLSALNGLSFQHLSASQQNKFLSRALRIVVLDPDTSDDNRRSLFDRINKSGRKLKPSERRIGALQGPFMQFLQDCAQAPLLRKLAPASDAVARRREHLELVTRFFAYSDHYKEFKHDVDKFLDNYIKQGNLGFDAATMLSEYENMLLFVEKYFPHGFAKSENSGITPRVRFEAISVGVNLALRSGRPLAIDKISTWIESERFRDETTTHASNSSTRLANRIQYVRDRLLGVEDKKK